MKRYKVTLTTEERCELRDLIAAGKAAAKKLAHARISAEGRCLSRRPCLDRPTHRRGGRSWLGAYRRAGPRQRLRGGGLGGSLLVRTRSRTDPAAEPQARWPGRGSPDRLGLLRSASGPPAMDATRLFWPTNWSSWRWWTPSATRRCGRTSSKKRAQAVAEGAVVHPAAGQRRVRVRDGGRAGGVPPTLRRASGRWSAWTRRASNLIGETVQPLPAEPGQAGAVRLRVSPQGHGEPVHDLRTPLGLAACRSHRATDGQGLRGGAAAWLVEDLHPGRRQGRAGDGQPQHPQIGIAVRGVPARPGTPHR